MSSRFAVPRRRSRLPGLLVLLAGVALAVGALTGLRAGGRPTVEIDASQSGIGRKTQLAVRADEPRRGLAGLTVELVQGEKVTPLLAERFAPSPAWALWGGGPGPVERTVAVGREAVPTLVEGEATVRVRAERAGTWLRSPEPEVVERTLPVRLRPPTVQVVSRQNYAAQGGSGVVVYRVGESAERSGVVAGERFFPGHPLPAGAPGERFALYGIPYDLADRTQIALFAADGFGNEAKTGFLDLFTPRPYATGTVEVSDDFLARVVPEVAANSPEIREGEDGLATYLAINRDLRKINDRRLVELAATSRPEFLWRQPFLPMRNAQVMSPFAARRTYLYQGKVVDEQFHLGFDLASVARAPIEAANGGVVAWAGYLGIYGNAVVLDHGYGLASLYGHLSTIAVGEGDRVERGQVLGTSGTTGLAAGDHLHFAMLLGGLPVNPVEWWDPRWIRDRVAAKLAGALPFAAEGAGER